MSIHFRATVFLIIILSSTALSAAAATPTVVVTWNRAALEEVRRARFGPPVVARALAVAHTCMYDAWAPYDSRAQAMASSTVRRPSSERTDSNKSVAISFAAYRCLSNLFPAGTSRLNDVMFSLGLDPLDTRTDAFTPQGVGNAAADAVIASRRSDGANQYGDLHAGAYSDYTGYASLNAPMPFCLPTTAGVCPLNISNPYHWQPLINNAGVTQTFNSPHWENVRPFALASGAQFDSLDDITDGPKYLKNPGKFKQDINSILSYSAGLTPQRKLVVEYWADGPASELPPGHWSLFAQFISGRDQHSIDDDVKMFFAMQNASFDAGIVAWHLKRKFDGVRPITAIRSFYQGSSVLAWGGPGRPTETIDGGKWTPYNPGSNLTPSFPGFVSGHSTFSSASATALRGITGTDTFGYSTVLPPNFGRVETGVPAVATSISYPTLTSAVEEAGLSRLYAGIHFSDDNLLGQLLGKLAGDRAWAKSLALFNNVPPAAYPSDTDVVCNNVFLDAQSYRSVEVPTGAHCVLSGTRLKGNLVLRAGASLDASNVVVGGRVLAQGARDVQLVGGRVTESVQLDDSQAVSVFGVSMKSLQVARTIGKTRLRDLLVNGDAQVSGNGGDVGVDRVRVDGNLVCDSNQQIPLGSGNTASTKQGQCGSL